MAKLRVYQLANQYKIPSKDFVTILNQHGIPVKNHMSALTDQQVKDFKSKYQAEGGSEVKDAPKEPPKEAAAPKQEAVKAAPEKEKKETKKEPLRKEQAAVKNKQNDEGKKNVPENKKVTQDKKKNEAEASNSRNHEQKKTEHSGKPRNNPNGHPKGNSNNRNEKTDHRSDNQSSANRNMNRKKKKGTGPQEPIKKNFDEMEDLGEDSAKSSRHHSKKGNPEHDGKKKTAYKQPKHNVEQPLKVKDHSKKGKTSRSAYKKIKAENKSEKMKNQVYEVPEMVTVGELAEILDCGATEIIKTLMMAGTMATINQQIDFETASLVADELGFEIQAVKMEDVVTKILEEYDEEETGNEVIRPPVVTVMGHVDHGKTSLLDKIRRSNVTKGEAGGITQHIGAYTVKIKGQSITFIDTPGHEAFTAMRSRGAQMTDIAVLVVAADDGVMPQTVEAINHAKAAKVPIIVAINKIDKDGANPERVKQELTEHNIVVEEWGGDVIAVPVSAKKGTNIEELLENILLVAEVEELKADPKRPARGCVIEARVKKGKGSTASMLVQQGTLHVGDSIISGTTYGKVRTMVDDKGRRIRKAGPSKPVEISGLSDIPVAGDDFIVLPSDKEARQLAEKRQQMEKDARQAKSRISLNDLFARIQEGQIQDINIIIKADVQGSVEALSQSLLKLSTNDIRINIIHGAVGAVNETDVMLASTSDAIIIGFNVRPDKNAIAQAESEKVDMRLYRVIYDAIEDVKKAMEGMLEPEFVEKVTGNAEVRDTFRIPGGTIIAGGYVTDGKISRNDEVRVIRDGIVIHEGKIGSLRRFKDDVKDVAEGYECGVGIENYNNINVGDIIETFVMEPVKREL